MDTKTQHSDVLTGAATDSALNETGYSISDLLDTEKLGDLLQDFSQATGFTATLVSHPTLNIVAGSGWRDICTRFHRACPESASLCRHSYEALISGPMNNSEARVHYCQMGLVEGIMPIIINGHHAASLLTGQILFDKPDVERFREQAKTYQFDPADYLTSLSEVPIVTETQFRKALSFLAGLASMIGERGLANLQLKESTAVLEGEIRERQATQLALAESERRFRSIVEASPMGIQMYRLNHENQLVFQSANQAADRILGVANKQFIGQTIEEAFPHLAATEIPERYRAAAREGLTWESEQVIHEGKTVKSAHRLVAFQTASERMAVMFLDITDRKRSEAELLASETSLRTILESTGDGILVVDRQGKVCLTNNRFAELWRIPPELIEAGDDERLITYVLGQLEDPEAFLAKVRVLYNTRDRDLDTLKFKDGRAFERFSSPLIEDNEVAGRVWSFRDVTERKLAQEKQALYMRRLKQANKKLTVQQRELEEFTYSVSHDLKAPVVSINGFAGIVAERARDVLDATCARYLERVIQNAHVMESLLADLLELSRIGRVEAEPTTIKMTDLVDEIIDSMSLRAEERQISLSRTTFLPPVTGLPNRIRQVVTNLVDNAIKYMPARKNATIEIDFDETVHDPSGRAGAFFVRDNGSGIARQFHRRIFGLFQRGPAAQAETAGTGVGLAAARRIIDVHGGYLWLRSTKGRGATFYFSLNSEKWSDNLDEVVADSELSS